MLIHVFCGPYSYLTWPRGKTMRHFKCHWYVQKEGGKIRDLKMQTIM